MTRVVLVLICALGCILGTNIDLDLYKPTKVLQTSQDQEKLQFEITVSETVFYKSGQILYFIVTPISGDPDMYIQTSGGHEWNSTHSKGFEIVAIEHTSSFETTIFHVTIMGYNGHCAFTLLSFIQEVDAPYIKVFPGKPQLAEVGMNGMVYFQHTSTQPGFLSFSCSDISGDTDICITTGGIRPKSDMSNCVFMKILPGSDVLQINQINESETYNIGIKSYNPSPTPTFFSLIVSGENDVITVSEGFPVREQLLDQGKGLKYFRYYLCDHNPTNFEGIQFTLIRQSAHGDVDLYIAKDYVPSPNHYVWKSTNIGSESDTFQLLYDASHPDVFSPGWFYVAVYNYQQTPNPIQFDFTVDRLLAHTTLLSGLPFAGIGVAGKFEYFQYYFNNAGYLAPFDVFVLTEIGNSDIYGSFDPSNEYPDSTHHDHNLFDLVVAKSITVLHVDKPQNSGMFYLGVNTNQTSAFRIVVQQYDAHVYISPGMPVAGCVPHDFLYYMCNLGRRVNQDVMINLNVVEVGAVDMYVSLSGRDANPENYDFMNSTSSYGVNVITIPKESFETTSYWGVIGIGVYGKLVTKRVYFTLDVSFSNETVTY